MKRDSRQLKLQLVFYDNIITTQGIIYDKGNFQPPHMHVNNYSFQTKRLLFETCLNKIKKSIHKEANVLLTTFWSHVKYYQNEINHKKT